MFDISDLQNIVYVIRSLTCNSLYMPPYLRFVVTAEKRESKSANFELLIKLLQTRKICEVNDQRFFETEGLSLLDFVYTYTEQMNNSARRSNNQNSSMQTDPAGQQEEPRENAEDTAATAAQSVANKQGLIKLILAKSQRSYRMVIDMLVKLNLAKIDMTLAREATLAITAYQSDHIRFLPQIEVIMADQ